MSYSTRSSEVLSSFIHHTFDYEHVIVFHCLLTTHAFNHLDIPNAFLGDIVNGTLLHVKHVANILSNLFLNGFVQKSTVISEKKRTTLWEYRVQSSFLHFNRRLSDMQRYIQNQRTKMFFCVRCNVNKSIEECFDIILRCPVDATHQLIEQHRYTHEEHIICKFIQDLQVAKNDHGAAP